MRVDGDDGRRAADLLEHLTGGDPGPVVIEANGRRGVYFLLPPGGSAGRAWPPGAMPFNAARWAVSYVPVPALVGRTWPLAWRCPPTAPGRFVHPYLLLATLVAVARATATPPESR